ncbi:MAG: GNAT family N-acetyltransferase [Cyclobacteriaceae bacterium]|nr:GNAT family N-acetyltransferase [Cyclobacteriaceae bacterium]
MTTQLWENGDYICTTDKEKLQTETIHGFLSERSYWAKGRLIEKVRNSIENSECFGIYKNKKQVGFARVISDFTIYAYILDVFILEEERGNGLGKWLMHCIMNHPELKEVHRWMLGTEDAHGLYAQYGFTPLKKVQNHMERVK